jgi:hypothetical protein
MVAHSSASKDQLGGSLLLMILNSKRGYFTFETYVTIAILYAFCHIFGCPLVHNHHKSRK